MSGGRTEVVSAKWHCERCNARGEARNSMAVAANHAKKTHHPVVAEQTLRTRYGGAVQSRDSNQRGLL